jgi:phosphoribosylanthranilate isomerase
MICPTHTFLGRGVLSIKICGVKTTEHALETARLGVDLIGVVFAPSRRQVNAEQARMIREALNTCEQRPGLVGLFVNAPAEEIHATVEACGLEYLQLSGDETPLVLDKLPKLPIIKGIRLDGTATEQAWIAEAATNQRVRLLVDAHVAGSYGGTGVLADWQRAATLAATTPLLLAGGLNADNVANAIQAVRPWGVDVSTGVETNGVKDSVKIAAFVNTARAVTIT